jgi:hypothetical protein
MDMGMTTGKDTWQVGVRRGIVLSLVVAIIFYLVIDIPLSLPINPAEISALDVVLYFLRMHFMLMGIIATVLMAFDWFAKFRRFLTLRQVQKKSMS